MDYYNNDGSWETLCANGVRCAALFMFEHKFIGANATIVCGVTIGKYALIGSGAVVTKDIPDFSLVIGNPGRIVGLVDKKGNRVQ